MKKQISNAVRMLSIDAINNAKSGHSGICLGAAPIMYSIWNEMNVFNEQPSWENRDRFVLASGHGSMLLYSMLHFSNFNITMEDIKRLKQINSNTPGHPEFGETEGVDVSTGPLGQGVGMAVGLAIAEKYLNKQFPTIYNHFTYVLCGDGDIMEGGTQEAISIAANYELEKLIVLYDSNDICLDGDVNDVYKENTLDRFKAANWNVILVENGNDECAISSAIKKAKTSNKPTIIEVKTIIGYGSKKYAGSNIIHGIPIGEEEREVVAKNLNWNYKPFEIPKEIYEYYNQKNNKQKEIYDKWIKEKNKFKDEITDFFNRENFIIEDSKIGKSIAGRDQSRYMINQIAKSSKSFIGGSADLASSNKTKILDGDSILSNGQNINFGIREFAMGTILNGISLHSNLKVFGSTFLPFSHYFISPIRQAAMMKINPIFVFTHDSILVGGDGPTHQPIEQLMCLRMIPNITVIRPGDANEINEAWKFALKNTNPTVLVFARHDLVTYSESRFIEDNFKYGAFEVYKTNDSYEKIIIATGSEVNTAIQIAKSLKDSISIKVVSMTSIEIFERQKDEYKNQLLNLSKKDIISLEFGTTIGWSKYADTNIGVDQFGYSANSDDILKKLKLTNEDIKNTIINID